MAALDFFAPASFGPKKHALPHAQQSPKQAFKYLCFFADWVKKRQENSFFRLLISKGSQFVVWWLNIFGSLSFIVVGENTVPTQRRDLATHHCMPPRVCEQKIKICPSL